MAVKLADAVVSVGVDNSDLDGGLKQSQTKVSNFGSVLSGLLAGVGIGIAQMALSAASSVISGVGTLIVDSIGSASDLSETQSKVKQIFGDSADAILAFGETAATTIGQTNQQALDALSTFGIYGKAAGLAGDDLVKFATDQAQLASDLASFNNTSPEQAIEAIGAALRGEAEPLRAYGVMLDDATLKQAAFDLGLTESADTQLTQQQKVLAAQKAIFDQTTVQQGDFARTSDGLANSQRTLAAVWEDFKTSLGTAFLPVIEQVIGVVKEFADKWLPVMRDTLVNKVIPAVISFGLRLGEFLLKYGTAVVEWVKGIIDWLKKFWQGTEETRDKGLKSVGALLQGIWNFAVSVGSLIGAVITKLYELVKWFVVNDGGEMRGWAKVIYDIFYGIIDVVTLVIDTISRLVEAMAAVVRGDWAGAMYALTRYNGSTSGMVPLLDSQGNRIGWQSSQQAAVNAGQVQQNSVSNTVNVNISTTSDPDQVARDLSRAVQDALRAGGFS